MKILCQNGSLKVVEQLRCKWIEYQVRRGRKVLSRHALAREAFSVAAEIAEENADCHGQRAFLARAHDNW